MKIETLAIRSTHYTDENAGAIAPPIYFSTTFERETDGSFAKDFIYSRIDNPNRQLLEKSLAMLENGTHAYAFASGLAAIASVLQLLNTGDHVIAGDDAYYAAMLQIREIFGHLGISLTQVDMTNPENVEKAIQPNTKLIWAETPSNPLLKITDIQKIAEIAHSHNALCGVDNTWATPILQKPLELGADIVQHSTTKYFGGHSDVLGGALIVKNAELAERIRKIQVYAGAVASPFDCWLLTRGIKTLPLRVKTQTENAKKIANFLNSHANVEVVHYPGLESHSGFETAKKQMTDFGGMLSFQVKGGQTEAMQVAAKLKLFIRATSLGGVESLIEHRRSIEGIHSQTPENLLRMSVGIEAVDDLIEDLEQALQK
jgi:cystathionine gamma-synthase